MAEMKNIAPVVMSDLRKEIVKVPQAVHDCSGIYIYGRRIRSVLFSTDVSIIANHNADAILAVYPFTPNPAILKSIMMVSSVPVFAGIGGGLTTGFRCANMGLFSESEGAQAVVINGPTEIETIAQINETIDIPIIYTVVSEASNIKSRIEAGVDILNISCGTETPRIVKKIREEFPGFPIMATGGPTEESVKAVIEAGANAVTITPPSNGELFKKKMEKYRKSQKD
ncbi:hydrolase [Streptococcus catagoni]|uniref:hydrolase n=1 Tax=Streptococcus catagoni TaxID=2654874 RepID=UPI0014098DB5|nr:hydrolase [Streptococcus catagoni]